MSDRVFILCCCVLPPLGLILGWHLGGTTKPPTQDVGCIQNASRRNITVESNSLKYTLTPGNALCAGTKIWLVE